MADVNLTRRGFEHLAKAIAGKQLTFTKVRLGDSISDGEIIAPTAEEQLEFSALINEKDLELSLTECRNIGGGVVAISFLIDNGGLTQGFYVREVGFYATVDNEEILFAYVNHGLAATWLPSATEETWHVTVTLTVVVEQAQNVAAIIDGSMVYLTRADLLEHINDPLPHPNIPRVELATDNPSAIWAADDDEHLHPCAVSTLSSLLGSNSNPAVDNRLNQVEADVSNLYLQLKAQTDLGLETNLRMIEDLKSLDCVDTFKARVTNAAASSVTLDNIDGLRAGSYYTITDGVNNEVVQVKAVASNGAVTLEDALQNNYGSAMIYRSTANIQNGKASGAATTQERVFEFNESFGGLSAAQPDIHDLGTNQGNVDAFELSGDWAFTADGFFTLV